MRSSNRGTPRWSSSCVPWSTSLARLKPGPGWRPGSTITAATCATPPNAITDQLRAHRTGGSMTCTRPTSVAPSSLASRPKPCGLPAASLDPGCGQHKPAVIWGRSHKIKNPLRELSTDSGDCLAPNSDPRGLESSFRRPALVVRGPNSGDYRFGASRPRGTTPCAAVP